MKPVHVAVVALLAVTPALPARADDARFETMVGAAAGVAAGWTVDLRDGTAILARTSARLCDAPDSVSLRAARAAYGVALAAWEKVAVLQTGPVADGTRAYRIMFWPDRRGQTARQMAPLLAGAPSELTRERLASASAAVQGLPAAEYLLFGDDAGPALLRGESRAVRCALLVATTANLAALAATVATEWQAATDPVTLFVDRGTPVASKAAANVLFTLMLDALTGIDEQKLGLPLGRTAAAAQPRQAESWRAGRSLDNIGINLRVVRALFESGGDASFAHAVGPDLPAIAAGFARVETALGAVNEPLDKAVADAKQRSRVSALRQAVRDLRGQLGKSVSERLGLNVGFNAMDGD